MLIWLGFWRRCFKVVLVCVNELYYLTTLFYNLYYIIYSKALIDNHFTFVFTRAKLCLIKKSRIEQHTSSLEGASMLFMCLWQGL